MSAEVTMTIEVKELIFLASPQWLSDVYLEVIDDEPYMLQLIDSIMNEGIRNPLEVSIYKGQASLSEGHHRLVAAICMGLKTVEIDVIYGRPNIFVHGVPVDVFWDMLGDSE